MSPTRMRGMLCAIGGCLAWGFSGTCAQYLLDTWHIPSLTLTTIRLLSACPILLALCALRGTPAPLRDMFSTRWGVVHILLFGLIGLFLAQVTYLETIAHTNAGTATMLGCLSSVTILAVVCIMQPRLPRAIEILGIALAIGATWLIATGGDPSTLVISPEGLIWGAASVATITAYTLQSKPLMARWGSMPVVAVGMLIGGIMCAAVALPQWSFPPLDLGGWAALAVMVLVGTCLSYSLFFQAILDLPPVEVGMLSIIEPIAATFFSVVWLGTFFTPTDYLGFALMIAMVIVIAIAGGKEDQQPEREATTQ